MRTTEQHKKALKIICKAQTDVGKKVPVVRIQVHPLVMQPFLF